MPVDIGWTFRFNEHWGAYISIVTSLEKPHHWKVLWFTPRPNPDEELSNVLFNRPTTLTTKEIVNHFHRVEQRDIS